MNKKNSYLFKNTLIYALSSFATSILSFLFVSLYTSVLSTTEFGLADLVSVTTTLLVYVFTLNISDAVLRFSIDNDTDSKKILAFGVRIVLIGGCVCSIVIGIIAFFDLFNWPSFCYFFLFLYFIFTSFLTVLSSYARSIDKVKEIGVSSVIISAITIICNVLLLVVFDLKLVGYLLANVIAIIFAVFYLIIVLKLSIFKVVIYEKCNVELKKAMIVYSVPLIFNGVAWWLNSAFDRYSINHLIGIEQNGLYSAASKIPYIVVIINTIFGQAWGISSIKDIDSNDEDGFFSKTYNMYCFVLVSIASILISFNIPLSRLMLKNAFFEAWRFSSILVISSVFNSLSSLLGGAFTKTMKTNIYAKTTVVSTIINVLLNIILISHIGAIGAAVATAISFFVLWIVRLWISKRIIDYKVNMLKHIVSFVMLLTQIIIEHIKRDFSFVQLIILLFLFVIYAKEIKIFLESLSIILKKYVKKVD